ncbi:MAG: protein-L-isoaspartate(D-aspartate) O-methyltransferase [Planctomycetes bacterium]|nr:protein-L-isoaspartate(D-aspartate) O-methyltransferase [Planctomycetota bacterium]
MVASQIESRSIRVVSVLRALRKTPRPEFVPPDQRHRAFDDGPLPIGYGQTISQPYIVALMTELAAVKPGDRVLEIGTGSGYQAAVLAECGAEVYSIEIIPELAKEARERLDRLGYSKVRTKAADGYEGWPEAAPFQAILITAAAGHVPPPLLDQLADGGRLVAPIGEPFFGQTLFRIRKNGSELIQEDHGGVRFVPMTGKIERAK